jgi:hypothetical protein
MLSRRTLLMLGLAGAAGVPFLVTESGSIVDKFANAIRGVKKGPDATINGPQPPNAQAPAPGQSTVVQAQIDGLPVQDLSEVLRFDITPGWIMSRWTRISTTVGADQFQGYRVPLVTGTAETDLAGSLTYYFSHKPTVQRIRFVGSTGDPSHLVALVTRRFGFVLQRSSVQGEYLYQVKWNGRPNCELRVRMTDVVRADQPLRRFEIDLEINLPDVPPSRPLG